MRLHILGPVELWTDGRRHGIGSPRQRGILALLALNVRKPVPIDVLIDRLWAENRPARATIHSYVARLRSALQGATDAARIELRGHGYVLEADPDLIDVHRFRRLRDQAASLEESGQYEQAAALLREAAALWTGVPLADLRGAWAEGTRVELDEERLLATIRRVRIELRLGRHAEVVGELTRLVAEHPFHEELIEHLMRALHGCGQTARALEVYRRERRRFVDELGTEPRQRLREVHGRLLAGDLDTPAGPPGPPPRRPNNLPRALPDFVGRAAELEQVLADRPPPGPVPQCGVIAIDGMPGVGKSTFAVHLAHRLAGTYPDAQLHLDLGAYGPHEPLGPLVSLARLLRMVGVPEDDIPPGLDGRADLWRARLAACRAVIVLDDAEGLDQISRLLPGASPSLVIITSRRRLSGLDGVRPFTLDAMSPDDAERMLHTIITPGQAGDADATAAVIHRCGALPLAIRIAATRLRDRPAHTVRDLADRLLGLENVLGALEEGDRSVRVAFELSYRALPGPYRRAFRLLGLHPGAEFTVEASAALLDVPHDAAVRAVDALLDHHLLEERSRGGYRFHDLLRGYAQERAEAEETSAGRAACLHRLGTYLVAVAEEGDGERLEMEVAGILGYAAHPYDLQPALAHAVAPFLETTARWYEAIDVHWRAVRSLRAAEDHVREAAAMVDLALVDLRCGRYEEAQDIAGEAVSVCRAYGDAPGEAAALDRLGLAHDHQNAFDRALETFHAAATIRRDLGDRKGEADALAHSGIALFHLGRYDTSILMFERSLIAYRTVGHVRGESESLNNLGNVQVRLGRVEDARNSYVLSSRLNEESGSPQDAAIALANIGSCCLALGETDEAFARFRSALGIYREIGDRAGLAEVMDQIGATYQAIGRDNEALIHHQSALQSARDAHEVVEECRALRHIGVIYTNSGKYRSALDQLDAALELAQQVGDPYERGLVLAAQGDALHRAHRDGDARDRWTEATTTLRNLGVPEADDIDTRLRDLPATGS